MEPYEITTICSWCNKYLTAEGTWVPVGKEVEQSGASRISHGICPSCSAKVRSEMKLRFENAKRKWRLVYLLLVFRRHIDRCVRAILQAVV